LLNGQYHLILRAIGGQQVITKAKHPGPELGLYPYALMRPIESPYQKPIGPQKITTKSNYKAGNVSGKESILSLEDFPLTSYVGEALY